MFYQVIGHYTYLKPEVLKSTNISDGAIFSTHVLAEEYAESEMYRGYEIKCHKGTSSEADYLIKEGFWTPVKS